MPFIDDMPAAFAAADLIVCRAGTGAVANWRRPASRRFWCRFPSPPTIISCATRRRSSGPARRRLVLDRGFDRREAVSTTVMALAADRDALERMGEAARRFAQPGAAARAAEILEEVAR